jgi:DNA-binding response OmpR family regulator
MRILLVEDDPMIGKTLHAALQHDRYVVDWVKDGQAARLALDTADGAYGLVLLDLGLPRKSGLDLLKEIRRAGNRVRVLIVTARDAVADRVAGLDAGADDYLVKPFSLDELAARMRALRRDVAREDGVRVTWRRSTRPPGR